MSRVILLVGVFCLIGFSACQFPPDGLTSAFYMSGKSYYGGYGTSFWFDATYPNFLRAKMVHTDSDGIAYHSALLGTTYYAWNVVQNVPVCKAKTNLTDSQMEIITAAINAPKIAVVAGQIPLDGDSQTFTTAIYGPNGNYPGFYMIRWDDLFYGSFHVHGWHPFDSSLPPSITEVPGKCLNAEFDKVLN